MEKKHPLRKETPREGTPRNETPREGTLRERAVLAALSIPGDPVTEEDLDELAALVETAGGAVAAVVLQNRQSPEPATLLGAGKCEEIAALVLSEEADFVVFYNDLSPVQMKNLADILRVPILDRTGVILDIFALRAGSAEGKLQVELAQYQYLLPRLVGQGINLSRQTASGGPNPIGTRGPGETKLESDRRHIRARIDRLKDALAEVRKTRATQRSHRVKSGMPLVALVGYTNAGKSTLLNALTGANVHTADRLFDTLDPTTRKLRLDDGKVVLLTDTVGFLRKLPHQLIQAFRATLEELSYADLILHVIDGSDERHRELSEVTDALTAELAQPDTPRLYVYNKLDLGAHADLPAEGAHCVHISASTGAGLDRLRTRIAAALDEHTVRFAFEIPYAAAALAERLQRDGKVETLLYEPDCIRISGCCDPKTYGQIRKRLEGYRAT